MNNPSVLIFRKILLAWSETFIADQGSFLDKYKAVYCGFEEDKSGKKLLLNAETHVLGDYCIKPLIAKYLFRTGYINRDWLHKLKQNSPGVIHAHFLNDGTDAVVLKKKLNLPLVTTLHGHDITKKEKKGFLKKNRAYFFKQVDKVIAVSDYIYSQALANGCPENKLVKHSIGIDLKKFSQDKHESVTPELLFVGRLVEKKGCSYLLEALTKLKANYPDLKLTIVGAGPLKNKLQEKVNSDKLKVDFVGQESAELIRDRLAKTWVFAAPSITAKNGDAEGLGMVFLEAQALRTPVVSYKSGGVVEAVEHGVTGLLSEEKDIQALAANIEYFIENSKARIEYGNRGRKRVEKYFDIRQQCKLLENIYDSVR